MHFSICGKFQTILFHQILFWENLKHCCFMKKYFGKVPNNIVSSNFILKLFQTSLFEKNHFKTPPPHHRNRRAFCSFFI